ncbi:MAG TPA: hypothetical protein PKH79_00135 [Prolixibacteraceae bacterium]|nr:hypothetical protein [Prolixibacteraceae bacterium]
MSSEDYLIRYFRQLGSVIAALFDYRKRKMYSEAIEEIDMTLDTWFKINPNNLADFESKTLNELLENPSPGMETEKSLAELFYQKAETLRQMGNQEEATRFARISLTIYKKIDTTSGDYSIENQQRIAELDQMAGHIDEN